MAEFNFQPVGYDVIVDLIGEATLSPGAEPLTILLAESHESNDSIGQHVRNARNLIRAKVVGLVGVEEFTYPVNIIKVVSEEFGPRKAGSIEAYAEELLEDLGGVDKVIAKIRSRPFPPRMSFVRYLLYLCPDVPVVGVEDPALAAEAQAASEAVACLFQDEPDPVKRRILQIAKFRADGRDRELRRDAAFLRFAQKAYEDMNPGGAILINGGGEHIMRIADRLKADRKAYVLILPEGYESVMAAT